jgi:hypothetical protein
MYRNESEEKLLKQVNLSELTAVNFLKDPKGRREHMFGLFTPSRNYHFQAKSAAEARSWVEIIRAESRIDEEEESVVFGSPPPDRPEMSFQNFGQSVDSNIERRHQDRFASSSPEPSDNFATSIPREGIRIPGAQKTSMNELDYSGQEHGSYSDFSDTAPSRGNSSVPSHFVGNSSRDGPIPGQPSLLSNAALNVRPTPNRNGSQISTNAPDTDDQQRVIWQGWLLCLKSKGGVRQWKKLWVVLRSKHLAFYKTDDVSFFF